MLCCDYVILAWCMQTELGKGFTFKGSYLVNKYPVFMHGNNSQHVTI